VHSVEIASEAIDPGVLTSRFGEQGASVGALVSFTGRVRGEVAALAIEHYPGMTEARIEAMMASAARRWPVEAAQVVHRVGTLMPGEPIVWIGVASAHRAAAFSACEYLMDYLKVAAPLWKREQDAEGTWRWVEAREQDEERSRRWGVGPRMGGAGGAGSE